MTHKKPEPVSAPRPSLRSRLYHYVKTRWNHFRSRRHSETPTDKFARRTSNATVILAITSGATVWLLWNQLSEMRLDQRAWLGVDKVDRFDFKPSQDFSIQFGMTNTGKTPALHVKTWIALKSLENGQKFTATYPGPQPNTESNSVVQPQQHMALSTLPIELSTTQYGDIQNGRGILYAFGIIRYDDIYSRPHKTTFCLMYYVGLSGPITCDVYNEAN
jgi:hypothetical protein